MAKAVGLSFNDIHFDRAFCSTSERTLDTAMNIIGDRDIPLKQRKDLKEINFGSIEGDPMDQYFHGPEDYIEGFHKYGGESVEEAADRALCAWKSIAEEYPDETVLVVTHGGVIMNAMMRIDKEKIEKEIQRSGGIANCSVSILDIENGNIVIETLNDVSYRDQGMNLVTK